MKMLSFFDRKDLPMMRLPLVTLMTIETALFCVSAGKLMTNGLYGMIFSVIFLSFAAACYSMIIFVWRNIFSLGVVAVSFAVMCMLKCDLLCTTIICLGVLILSYTHATSVITGGKMFERIMKLTVTGIIIITLSGIAYAGRFDGGYASCTERIYEYIKNAVSLYLASIDSTYALAYGVVTDSYTENLTSSIYSAIPAAIVCVSEVSAWIIDITVRKTLKLLGAEDDFIPITHRITLPKVFAVVQIVSAALMMIVKWDDSPEIYIIVRNVFLSTALPCVYIATVSLWRFIVIKLYFLRGKRLIATFVMITPLMMLGISYVLVLCGVLGSLATLRKHRGSDGWLLTE